MKRKIFIIGYILLLSFPISSKASWIDKIKDTTSNYKKLKKDEAIEKLEQEMVGLHTSLIEISKIGFIADEVRIVSGKPLPHAEIFFSDIGATGQEISIIDKNSDKKTLHIILKLLNETRKINIIHFEIKRVKIDFTFPPKISLITKVVLHD